MSDNLTVFGKNYTSVTGIKAKGTGNGTLTYIRPSGTKSISTNGTGIDVASYASVDVSVPTGVDTSQDTVDAAHLLSGYTAHDSTGVQITGTAEDLPVITIVFDDETHEALSASFDRPFAEILATEPEPSYSALVIGSNEAGTQTYLAGTAFLMASDYRQQITYTWTGDYPRMDITYYSNGTVTITNPSTLLQTLNITTNGSYWPDGLHHITQVNVAVPGPSLQSKTATPTESQQSITPDSGYNGLSSVTVGAIPSTYVGSGITRRNSTDLTISDATITAPAGYYSTAASKSVASGMLAEPTVVYNNAGTYTGYITITNKVDTEGYLTANSSKMKVLELSTLLPTQMSKTITPTESAQTAVTQYKWTTGDITVAAIPSDYIGSGITLRSSIDLTASEATVTVPAGYYAEQASKAVANGTEGTPTAIKGTVSNHAVTVTPSVTNTAGYITGGTKTGTAVSVSASELVSGTYTVSASGTHDVTNYASASVAAGGATASASKGTVSNHSITVTPSVTKTAGYITAGSANGTAVTVSASELVSGTLTISSSGTKDVTNYASASVAAGSATGPTTLSGSSATVSTGTNTLTLTKTNVTTTPTVSAGYVSSATASTATVTLTASVTTKAAATITPSTSNQTISAGTYLTGTQTIAGDADLVASNIVSTANIFGVQGSVVLQSYYTGTSAPSSSLGQNGDIYIQQ